MSVWCDLFRNKFLYLTTFDCNLTENKLEHSIELTHLWCLIQNSAGSERFMQLLFFILFHLQNTLYTKDEETDEDIVIKKFSCSNFVLGNSTDIKLVILPQWILSVLLLFLVSSLINFFFGTIIIVTIRESEARRLCLMD